LIGLGWFRLVAKRMIFQIVLVKGQSRKRCWIVSFLLQLNISDCLWSEQPPFAETREKILFLVESSSSISSYDEMVVVYE
jgi:hypothetical protein